MSTGIWPHATKQHHCTICGGEDWCTFGSVAMLCQRIESAYPAKVSGWYHYYDGKGPRPMVPVKKAGKVHGAISDFGRLHDLLFEKYGQDSNMLALSLGVSIASLVDLQVAWCPTNRAYAFPMRSGEGEIIGIRLRNISGDKWAVTGSRQGIFIPDEELKAPICFLPEGPTNTAALLTLGLFAIGRPNVLCGGEQIKVALKRLGIFRAVIVADNDLSRLEKLTAEKSRLESLGLINSDEYAQVVEKLNTLRDGDMRRPGIDGAQKLKKELAGISSCIWIPPAPFKDVRDFLKAGGTRQLIESDLKGKIWTK